MKLHPRVVSINVHFKVNLLELYKVVNFQVSKIFHEISKLREEVKEVKGLLKQSKNCITVNLPNDAPVTFPLNDFESFQILEQYLGAEEKHNDLVRCISQHVYKYVLIVFVCIQGFLLFISGWQWNNSQS